MTAPTQPTGGLADTLNILLDKGMVIDATVRVSVIGIELLTVEARIVIASCDTYIRFLEALQRLELAARTGTPSPISQGLSGTIGLIPPPPPAPAIAVAAQQPACATPAAPAPAATTATATAVRPASGPTATEGK